jgi:hypothetical protein
MTQESAKELLPIIQAFAEGKIIENFVPEMNVWTPVKNLWIDHEGYCKTDPLFDKSTLTKFRIKPEIITIELEKQELRCIVVILDEFKRKGIKIKDLSDILDPLIEKLIKLLNL